MNHPHAVGPRREGVAVAGGNRGEGAVRLQCLDGDGGFNRRHVRSGVAEFLDVVCFNECSDCEGSDASVDDATVIFGLFPIPVTDREVLTGAQGSADVFVLDVQGREVMSLNSAALNGRFELNVAGLETGVYTVVICQGLRQGAQRILVH